MSKEISRKIRKLCNHPWKRALLFADRSKWHKLWASLDLINDTQEAIDYYSKIPKENFKNGGYLYVFGLLQSLYVQQDAALNLNKALFQKTIDFKEDFPDLFMIRAQRNNSIGHPTGRGKNDSGSYHIIDGTSINKSGFDLVSHYPKNNKSFQFNSINLDRSIKVQEKLINEILIEVMNELKSDFDQHKKKFKGTPLIEIVKAGGIDYSISKLYEFESPLIPMNFKIISETYDKIKAGIKKRYTSLEALPGVELTCDRIDYILPRLERDLVNSRINDELEIEIFVDALKSQFEELVEMIKEIDDEFK